MEGNDHQKKMDILVHHETYILQNDLRICKK